MVHAACSTHFQVPTPKFLRTSMVGTLPTLHFVRAMRHGTLDATSIVLSSLRRNA